MKQKAQTLLSITAATAIITTVVLLIHPSFILAACLAVQASLILAQKRILRKLP